MPQNYRRNTQDGVRILLVDEAMVGVEGTEGSQDRPWSKALRVHRPRRRPVVELDARGAPPSTFARWLRGGGQ